LVIRVSRDPAESTSTSPLPLALAELGELLAELGEVAEVEEEELLQPVAATPAQAIDTHAAIIAPRRCVVIAMRST
jgi:hypothetical protein